jgi:hypothetical protein
MKKRYLYALTLLIVAAVISAYAAAPGSATKSSSTPGGALAETVSTVTGVAISPLLGMSAVGAYQWWRCPSGERANLPFYAQTWFWLPGLLLVGGVAAKDALGAATPPGLKKPLDVAETLENKLSGLVATGALLPILSSIIGKFTSADAGMADMGLAAISGADVLGVLALPFALAVYLVVWLVSHAINVLILISPWGGLDAVLKTGRTAVLGLIALTAKFDPLVSAFLSVAVILFAWLVAGWSFRMMIFGSVFAWDFLTRRRSRFNPQRAEHWAFTARKIEKVPIRTYGRLVPHDDGTFQFRYRPWLVLKPRTLEVPAGKLFIGNALLYPSLLRDEGERERSLFNFPPRYRTHEAEIAKQFGLELRDIGLIRGFKAAWRWLKELFGAGTQPAAPAVSVGN